MKVKVSIFSFYGFESFAFAELYHKCVILSMFYFSLAKIFPATTTHN